ncbi:MAG: ATP-binding protein [Proteobacteria bacterium]|nr:ATP-binding protein [Pseudomonadota bacterium]
MAVMELRTVEDTILWKTLKALNNKNAHFLSANVLAICEEAENRSKIIIEHFPEYTIHDQVHLLRATELMGLILGDKVNVLNAVELSLLILSSYLHDQGMVLEADEQNTLEGTADFVLFRDNWYLNHPNRKEIQQQIAGRSASEKKRDELIRKINELDSGMVTAYLRTTHGIRSKAFVLKQYEHDRRLDIAGRNLSHLLSQLCLSHCEPTTSLIPNNGFNYDEQVGTYAVNMPFLAVILRLADILDFDSDRAPDTLYQAIHFTNDVSVQEWEKHRAVQGWTISQDLIRFTMYFKHPVYEATARRFMDMIDSELIECKQLIKHFPANCSNYRLDLPDRVDRSRLGPQGNAYIYHDLEFSLSRDEIIRLLLLEKLYRNPSLCVRELLQNALDALRYRKALHSCNGIDWKEGKVEMHHATDDNGYEIISCRDNGVGMDENTVTSFLCKVGRSFYRSPQFEQERLEFRKHNCDFDPVSRFGIGFMSCFMLGDRIIIQTRRDYGAGREYGRPLMIEINGLSSMVVIKEGTANLEVGTMVTIVSRKKPGFLDEWKDRVKLTTVLKGYAVAVEFPVHADCLIPEIADTVEIPPEPEKIPTLMEYAGLKNIVSYEQNFCEIDVRLGGSMRESFLIDQQGLPAIENAEAAWKTRENSKDWELFVGDKKIEDYPWNEHDGITISADGILIAGEPGRASFKRDSRILGYTNSQIYGPMATLLDVRGEMKPELTPARTRPDRSLFNSPPGWRRLDECVGEASGKIWGKVATRLEEGLLQETFWKLGTIYRASFRNITPEALWSNVGVSVIGSKTVWPKISHLGKLTIDKAERGFKLRTEDGSTIGPDENLQRWEETGTNHPELLYKMNSLVLLMSVAIVEDKNITLMPEVPNPFDGLLSHYYVGERILTGYLIPFKGVASKAIALQTPIGIANRSHPLSQLYVKSRLLKKKNDIEEFASYFLTFITSILNLNEKSGSLEKPEYGHKQIGYQYFEVDWQNYDMCLKPPYTVWVQGKGWTIIDEGFFERWKTI